MMHVYHEKLPGFDARQIWHDGCPECDVRGQNVPRSVGTLDSERLARAWMRMRLWDTGAVGVGPLSNSEIPLLHYLESVRLTCQALARLEIDPAK